MYTRTSHIDGNRSESRVTNHLVPLLIYSHICGLLPAVQWYRTETGWHLPLFETSSIGQSASAGFSDLKLRTTDRSRVTTVVCLREGLGTAKIRNISSSGLQDTGCFT